MKERAAAIHLSEANEDDLNFYKRYFNFEQKDNKAILLTIHHSLVAKIPGSMTTSANYQFNQVQDDRLGFYTSRALICLINQTQDGNANATNSVFKLVLNKFIELNSAYQNNGKLYIHVKIKPIIKIFEKNGRISLVNYIKNITYVGKDKYEKAKSNRDRVNNRITDTHWFESIGKLEPNLQRCGEAVSIKVTYIFLLLIK